MKRQQQEAVKDNEAYNEAASSPGRSSSNNSNSSNSRYVGSSSSGSSEAEVPRGRMESRNTRAKAAAAREKATTEASGASGGFSRGASGPDGSDSARFQKTPDGSDSVRFQKTHQLRRTGTPVGLSDLEKVKMSPLVGAAQAVAVRSSPGWENSSVIGGSLKTHRAAPDGGKSVCLNLNVSPLPQQSVDLQTVDGLHVSGAVAGGGDALNAHSKGLNSTVGLNSTAGSTVDHSERQLLQLQQQHGTVQSHPLTQGGPAQISGGGDAVGVLQQNSTVQNRTDLTSWSY